MAEIPIVRSPMRPARKGEAPTLEWARWVESTIRRIIDIPTPPKRPIQGGEFTHPFKMFASVNSGNCRLHVWRGACTANSWAWNDTDVWGTTNEIVPGIGSGSLISATVPIGDGAAGYLTLSPSTTYGIWLMVGAINNFPAASAFNPIPSIFPASLQVHFQRFNFGTAAIHANSTNTDAADAAAMGLVSTVDTKNLAIYIGKVVVDAAGVGTITQYRTGDVEVHSPLMTAPVVVSTDTTSGGNTITPGANDGGAYLP